MSQPIELNLSKEPIYDHCFFPDRTKVAITNGCNVEIYSLTDPSGKPKLLTVLSHHDKPITALDISIDGKIVTCSQDRNALVWITNGDGTYKKPTLVLLRINRAATCVKWSPNGKKFAVGSAARVISVCYFEEENDWWISKHIKRPLKSTILSLDWHPNNVLLACGSTDSHVRVFSAYIKGIDAKPEPSVWGERLPFKTLCLDFSLNSWVHDVKFDPTAQFVGAVTHDGCLNFIYPGPGELEVANIIKVKTSSLPFQSLIFASSSKVIVAGHDCHPFVFEGDSTNGWKETGSIDDPSKKQRSAIQNQSALNMFRQLDLKGSKNTTSSKLLTIHQNAINVLRPFQVDDGGIVTRFSSCGNDGKVVIF